MQMTNKRRHDKHEAYQELTTHGVHVQKHDQIRLNSGSESLAHQVAKLCVAHLGKANGYWVASEVPVEQPGNTDDKEADIVLWGHPERLTYVCETETGWSEETKDNKVKYYVESNPVIDDMLPVEVNDHPDEWLGALAEVSDQIGLKP